MKELIDKRLAIDTAIDAVDSWDGGCNKEREKIIREALEKLPSIAKSYTKADYIMALHKEYGVSLEIAKKAHDKALEYLQSKARMKG